MENNLTANTMNRKITGICTHEENGENEILYNINASYEEKLNTINSLRGFFYGEEAKYFKVDKKITGIRDIVCEN